MKYAHSITFLGVLPVILALLSNCGGLGLGSSTPNDALPTGTPVYQGSFTSENGKTVTGTAAVYFSSGSSYIVRLEGISTPSETGMQVQVVANGSLLPNQALRAYSGNQNYTVSATPGSTFSNVYIYSTQYNLTYGNAQLLSPN